MLVKKLKRLGVANEGATAVETALILPIIITIIIGIMQVALVFNNVSLTKDSLDLSVREILLVSNPSNAAIDQIVSDNIYQSSKSAIVVSTTYETKFGSDYANISANISYSLSIPFVHTFTVQKQLTNSIILNR